MAEQHNQSYTVDKKYLDNHWKKIKEKSLKPIWYKYKKKYESIGLEYGDFLNIAYIMLAQEIHKYNPQQSGIYTYVRMFVSKRMYSYIRTISERDKTKASVYHESLNAPIKEGDNTTLEEIIPDEDEDDNTDCKKVHKYLSNLSRIQKDILIYRLLGFEQDDITSDGGITKKQYQFAMSNMKMTEKMSMFNLKGRLK